MERIAGRGFALYRLAYNLFSLLLVVVLLVLTRRLDNQMVMVFAPPWSLLRYALLSVSAVLIFWPLLFNYDALEFLGIRQIGHSPEKRKVEPPETISRRGLLGIVRHPMYLGTIIFLWSLNSTRADIVVHAVLTIYILIGIQLEEKKLVAQYGDAYVQYQRAVPALIPFGKKRASQAVTS